MRSGNLIKGALRYFSAFFILTHFQPVFSQHDTMVIADSLVITASRLPHKAILSSPYVTPLFQAKLSQATSVNDYLQNVPGLFTMSPDNYAQDSRITSRGFGARSSFGIRGIKIWVDEIPETTPDGQSQLDNLDFNLIEEIEVLRGPNGALYGNVSGAMLKISQADLSQIVNRIQFRLAFGSYGFKQAGFTYNRSKEKLNYQLSYGYHEADGYRNWSAFKNHVANFRGRYKSGSDELTLLLNAVYNPVSQDAGAQTLEEVTQTPQAARRANEDFKAGEQVTQERLGVVYKHTSSSYYFQAKSYILHRDFDNALGFQSGGKVNIQRICGGIYAEVGNSYSQNKHHWILGADFQSQLDRRKNFDNNFGVTGNTTLDQKETYSDLSFYLLNSFRITDKLNSEVNFRFSSIGSKITDDFYSDGNQSGEQYNTVLSPTINLSYQLTSMVGSRFQYATGFETPTLAELAINPNGQPGLNRDLVASSSRGFEFLLHIGRTLENYLDLQVFSICGLNEFLPFESKDFPGRFYYKNTGTSRRQGYELSLRKQLSNKWSVVLNHSKNYMKGTDITINLPGIPQHLSQLQLYFYDGKKIQFKFDNTLVGKIYLTSSSPSNISNYVVGGLQASYVFRGKNADCTLTAGLNNLYGVKYYNNLRINAAGGRYYEAAPGRNVWIRINYNLSTLRN